MSSRQATLRSGPPWWREPAAEMVGSFILCFFGPGSVAVAVLTGAHQGLWQVASVWGFAIALAIYAVGAISGCHINPAVTVAMAIFRRSSFPARKIAPFIAAQMVGGVLAALVLLSLFGPTCRAFEQKHEIVRGAPGSQLSAMWFGEYFPNPGTYGTDEQAFAQVTPVVAFAGEAVGTTFLLFFIMALTDSRNREGAGVLTPLMIGFTVAAIISIVAPLTQAGLNPMRDFAPRIVAYFAGWREIAIPGPRGCEWWIYIVAPVVGGIVGAGAHQALRFGVSEESQV
jgi:glycerol uptake facilitator protein